MPLPAMKTPAEFIDYYFQQLQNDFGNVKLSKTGFMGFMLNMMGNIQYDNKNYYDNLFLESFPALAQDDKNLQLHASLHGYNVAFAQAASVNSGTLELDLAYLPSPRAGLVTRTVTFGANSASTVNSATGDQMVFLSPSAIPYTIDATYVMTARVVNSAIVSYYAEIKTPNGIHSAAAQLANPSLPLVSALQYSILTNSASIPFYPIGSYYTIDIPLAASDMIYKITANVTDSKTGKVSSFNVVYDKNPYDGTSKVLFYTILSGNTIRIECGSGIKGYYLQEASTVDIIVKITRGEAGNINPPGIVGTLSPDFATTATVTDTYADNTIATAQIDLLRFVKPNIATVSGGKNVLTGTALRDDIIKYVQTRDNLISQLDYTNILSQAFQYYSVMFNKSKMSSNTIDLQVPLTDEIGTAYPSLTTNITKAEFETNAFRVGNEVSVYLPSTTSAFGSSVSPFYYRYDSLFRSYVGNILHQGLVLNYTNLNNLSTTVEAPYIYLTVDYYHNATSPYTIVSIQSYEDISAYVTNGSISIEYVSQGLVTNTSQSFYLTPVNQHSGINSTLSQNLNIGDTTAYLVSTANFPLVGSVSIGSETIQYTGKDDTTNTLTGLIRGVNATADVATQDSYHAQSANVYDVTINNSKIDFIFGQIATTLASDIAVNSTSISLTGNAAQFPPSGSIKIGNEVISYTSKTGSMLNGCSAHSAYLAGETIYELETSSSAGLEQLLGCLISPTQLIITMTKDVVDSFGTVSNHTHVYTFSLEQVTNIRDYLFIKEYKQIGAISSVNGNVLATDTTIQVTDATTFPSSGTIHIGNEDILYTSTTTTSFDGCTRGANGTVAADHLDGELIQLGSLNADIDSFVTTIPATNTAGYVSPGLIRIDTEEITYTSTTTNSFNGCTRGVNGTVKVPHVAGTPIKQLTEIELAVPVVDSTRHANESAVILAEINKAYASINLPLNRSMGDEVQLKFLNTASLALPFLQQSLTNGALYNSTNAPNGILLPLKVSVSLLLNAQVITSTAADVASDIETLKLTIAQELANKYTGDRIRVSDADIVLLAKAIAYVDDANVTFTDSSPTPVNIANNEINVKPIDIILQNMTKTDRLAFNPALWHWDLNNIAITYTVE